MSSLTEPLTTTNSIAHELLELDVGDEVTVQTETGYKVNREITSKDYPVGDAWRTEFLVGDPEGPHLMVVVDELSESMSPKSRYNVYGLVLTDDPDDPVDDKGSVRKLWTWDE